MAFEFVLLNISKCMPPPSLIYTKNFFSDKANPCAISITCEIPCPGPLVYSQLCHHGGVVILKKNLVIMTIISSRMARENPWLYPGGFTDDHLGYSA